MTPLAQILTQVNAALAPITPSNLFWGMPVAPLMGQPDRIVVTWERNTSIAETNREDKQDLSIQVQYETESKGLDLASAISRATKIETIVSALHNWQKSTELPIEPGQVQCQTGQIEATGSFGAVVTLHLSYLESN